MGGTDLIYKHTHAMMQVYLSVYGVSGDAGQYTLRVETGVTELQSAVRVCMSRCERGCSWLSIHVCLSDLHTYTYY